ncbi:Crp/Fnr family transcriptional regulator [Pseudomonas putida]|uniref:Crp/Fnr family transcriptional regulator n=1 Tax=Pseudomonas putida TaxID=303 RepID=UPI003345358F
MTNEQIIELAEQRCKAHAVLLQLKRGEYLFREGDTPDSLYLIERGIVKVSQTTTEGDYVTFFLRSDGESTGLTEAVLGRKRLRHAQCLTDCAVHRLPSEIIGELMSEPAIAHGLLLKLSTSFLKMQENFTGLSRLSVASRLKSLLRHFAKVREDGLWDVALPITHEEISNVIGCSRQKTTELLSTWKREGLVQYSRDRFVVIDWAAMEAC